MTDPMVLFDDLDDVIEKHSKQLRDDAILAALAAHVVSIVTDDEDVEQQGGRLQFFLRTLNDALAFVRNQEETEKQTCAN